MAKIIKQKKSRKKRQHLVPVDDIRKIMERERDRKGLSQKDIAKRMGISDSWLSNMETGQRDIRWDVWVKWCEGLRVSPTSIMDKWLNFPSGQVVDKERKAEYYQIINDMVSFGFNAELDVLMVYYGGLVKVEKEDRRKRESKRQLRKWTKLVEGPRKPSKTKGEGKDNPGI